MLNRIETVDQFCSGWGAVAGVGSILAVTVGVFALTAGIEAIAHQSFGMYTVGARVIMFTGALTAYSVAILMIEKLLPQKTPTKVDSLAQDVFEI